MTTKKIVLFIVEGRSDQTSLSLVLSRIINNNSVKFHIVGGDITSDISTTDQNAINTVDEQIRMFLNKNHFQRTDLLKVVHLVDTDGTYVGRDCVVEAEVNGFVYSPDCITAPSIDGVCDRNGRKRRILNKLCSRSKIGGIDYRVYYFSCNLEHVLHNEQNAAEHEKMRLAESFEDRYIARGTDFIDFITNSDFSVAGSYNETWRFIRMNKNSLCRYSNFHLFFS